MYLFLRPRDTEAKDDDGNLRNPDGYSLHVYESSWSGLVNDVCLTPDGFDVTVDVPNFTEQELLHKAIGSLKEKQKNALAEAEKRRVELQGMIDKLLLIEHKPDDYVPESAATSTL